MSCPFLIFNFLYPTQLTLGIRYQKISPGDIGNFDFKEI